MHWLAAMLDEQRQQEAFVAMRDPYAGLPLLTHSRRLIEVSRRDHCDHPIGASQSSVYLVEEIYSRTGPDREVVDLVANVAQHRSDPAPPRLVLFRNAEKDSPDVSGPWIPDVRGAG
jgi:hypothetical protein